MDLISKYDNAAVRRQDRLLDAGRAIELLWQREYGFLALGGEGGYGVPLNYAVAGHSIYFHCAPEGEKLRALAQNNRVSFCVVGTTKVISNKFTTAYQSVLAKGTLHTGLSDEEKMHALEVILDKYSPNEKVIGLKDAEKSFHRTEIMRLDIQSVSGKCKPMP